MGTNYESIQLNSAFKSVVSSIIKAVDLGIETHNGWIMKNLLCWSERAEFMRYVPEVKQKLFSALNKKFYYDDKS